MASIDTAVDRGGEDDPALLLKPLEGRPPFGVLRREPGTGDGDKSPAGTQTGKGGRHVPPCSIGDMAFDIGADGERRIHENNGGPDRRIEMIIDMGCVVPEDGNARKQPAEQIGARGGELVEGE